MASGAAENSPIVFPTNALLLRSLPYHNSDQLVSITFKDNVKDNAVNLLRFELVRDANRSFQSVAVWTNDNLNLADDGEPFKMYRPRLN